MATSSIHLPGVELDRTPVTVLKERITLPTPHTDLEIHGNLFRLLRYNSALPTRDHISDFERLAERELRKAGVQFVFEPYFLDTEDGHRYHPDFLTDLRMGRRHVLLETKGFLTKPWVKKFSRIVDAYKDEYYFVLIYPGGPNELGRELERIDVSGGLSAHEIWTLKELPKKLGKRELELARNSEQKQEPSFFLYTAGQATVLLRKLRELKLRSDPNIGFG